MRELPLLNPGDPSACNFLVPFNLTPCRTGKGLWCAQTPIKRIARKSRYGVAPRQVFGNSAAFWLNRQTSYDIDEVLNGSSHSKLA